MLSGLILEPWQKTLFFTPTTWPHYSERRNLMSSAAFAYTPPLFRA